MPYLDNLSRLGVLPAIICMLYAPMFDIPMSSPMMTKILGCFVCAEVETAATKLKITRTVAGISRRINFTSVLLIFESMVRGYCAFLVLAVIVKTDSTVLW